MAVITVVKCKNVTPVGYEVVDRCVLAVDVVAGDQLVYTGVTTDGQPVMDLAPITGIVEAHGIAMQNGYAGQAGFDVGIQGEMDGFSGLTPGAPLYPSTITVGKLNTTPIASAPVRVRAVRAGRVRYSFI